MIGKVVVSGISIILVVGVVIGVIAGVHHHNEASNSSPAMKAVTSICAPTDYKDVCVNSLKSVAQNASATPKDIIQEAVQSTINEMRAAFDTARGMKPLQDARDHMAMDDCKDLMQFAIDELQTCFSTVGDNEIHTLADRVVDLKNWLSAVISYQQSCVDGITIEENKGNMTETLRKASQLTSNALAIVSEISDIASSLKLEIPSGKSNATQENKASSGRRLLGHTEVGSDGFPTWFSASDRRLLARHGAPGRGAGGRPGRSGAGVPKPDAVVAKDGSGQYKTIMAALAAYPPNHNGRFVIYVKAGLYEEEVLVDKKKVNVFMYGDGPRRTIVTGRKSFTSGYTTSNTASFAAIGNGFVAKSMGFTNTAGPDGHQAVALRVQSDMSAFFNCRMDGHQDTLYVQTHRQFYRNCVISGTVDFIFGDSNTLIQNSLIIARKPNPNQQNTITAQGRQDRRETTGLVIQNCRIVPEQKLFAERFKIPTFLGRPWKEYSRTIIMESTLADFIQPAGWMPWQGEFALNTLFYAEYGNRGPGSRTDRRVRWKGVHMIGRQDAQQFTAGPFLQGDWIKNTGAPFQLGLTR